MEAHFQLSDVEFARQFEQCSLPPQLFTHTAHLRLGWILLQKMDAETAGKELCRQIAKFDRIHGDGTKFDTEITMNAVRILHNFMQQVNSTDFQDLLVGFPRLQTHFKELLQEMLVLK